MKKILLKIVLMVIVIIMSLTIKSYASEDFRASFKGGLSVKDGETLEIPLIIDDIKFDKLDDVQDGIIGFSCNIEYDEDIFTFVEFVENEKTYTKEIDGEIEEYNFGTATYTDSAKKLIFRLDINYLKNIKSSNIEIAEIGTFKFNVKKDAPKGNYYFKTLNVYGGNDEQTTVAGKGLGVPVFVDGKVIEEAFIDDGNVKDDTSINRVTDQEKPVKVKVEQNADGTKVIVTPNEKDGIQIGYIMVGDNVITKNENGRVTETRWRVSKQTFTFLLDG